MSNRKPYIAKFPYESHEGWRWYIQTFHHTGMRMDPQSCPKFRSKPQAAEHLWFEYGLKPRKTR